jgi:hypothetical protein
MDPNITMRLNRDNLMESEIDILTKIDHIFPEYTPHMFISYFLRYLSLLNSFFLFLKKKVKEFRRSNENA